MKEFVVVKDEYEKCLRNISHKDWSKEVCYNTLVMSVCKDIMDSGRETFDKGLFESVLTQIKREVRHSVIGDLEHDEESIDMAYIFNYLDKLLYA